MAKRTILSDAEKKIKEKFNVEGASFDDLIESLSTKVNTQPSDDKYKKEIDLLKAKNDDLSNKYNGLLTNVTKIETKTKVTSKLSTVFDKIDFPSNKVKELAINDFVEQFQFEEAESGLYAKQGERVIIDIENLALNHFKEYGKVKEVQNAKPNVTFPNTSYTGSKTMDELFAEIPKAKNAEERAQILDEIAKLEAAKK
jgi:hypothetical protein